jgi:hypothetical protein
LENVAFFFKQWGGVQKNKTGRNLDGKTWARCRPARKPCAMEKAHIHSNRREFSLFRLYPSEGQFGLRALLAMPKYILAMKLLAFRLHGADVEDIRYLVLYLKRTSAEDFAVVIETLLSERTDYAGT